MKEINWLCSKMEQYDQLPMQIILEQLEQSTRTIWRFLKANKDSNRKRCLLFLNLTIVWFLVGKENFHKWSDLHSIYFRMKTDIYIINISFNLSVTAVTYSKPFEASKMELTKIKFAKGSLNISQGSEYDSK